VGAGVADEPPHADTSAAIASPSAARRKIRLSVDIPRSMVWEVQLGGSSAHRSLAIIAHGKRAAALD
jgi:hypothetical protein